MRVKEEFLQICQENYKLFNNCSGDIDTQDYSKKNNPSPTRKHPPKMFYLASPSLRSQEPVKQQKSKTKRKSEKVLLMEEILHQLIDSLIHYLQSLNNIPGGRDWVDCPSPRVSHCDQPDDMKHVVRRPERVQWLE